MVNLVLATGPFTYPQGFVSLGPVMSLTLLIITTGMAYITATFLIEAISIVSALQPEARTALNPYGIKRKIEIEELTDNVTKNKLVKKMVILTLVVHMYGAISVKYVAGAESFTTGINHTFWDEEDGFKNWLGYNPYYFGLFVFGFGATYASFGNIENANTLQVVISILRFLTTILMCIGSIYYIDHSGTHIAPVFNWRHQVRYLS